MILISALAPGEERTVAVQGQYLYLDTVRVGGALDGGVAVPVTILLESGRRSVYPLRSQDKISFGEAMKEIAVRNNTAQPMDVVLQNGWGNFSPRVELDAGTVTVEPGANDLNVHITGSDVALGTVTVDNDAANPVPVTLGAAGVTIDNDAANPVPVTLAGSGGGALEVVRKKQIVWSGDTDIVVAVGDTGTSMNVSNIGGKVNAVPPGISSPAIPAGYRLSGIRCDFKVESLAGAPAGRLFCAVIVKGEVTAPRRVVVAQSRFMSFDQAMVGRLLHVEVSGVELDGSELVGVAVDGVVAGAWSIGVRGAATYLIEEL